MQLLIGAVTNEVLFEVLSKVDVDDVDCNDQLGSSPRFVGFDQRLPLVPVGMVRVVERALGWVG